MKRPLLAGVALLTLMFSAPVSEGKEDLKPFSRGSWQEILRAHSGRPTIVHFWGVTCGPCKVELPLLGQFMKDHGAVDMVTVSADLVPDLPAATRAMLQKSGLGSAENWIFNDGFVERLRFEIDPSWQGDIPRTILISGKGETTTLEGSVEMTEIQKWFEAQSARVGKQ
jgi:thiol-disulfide isomerase/thioredoxin